MRYHGQQVEGHDPDGEDVGVDGDADSPELLGADVQQPEVVEGLQGEDDAVAA